MAQYIICRNSPYAPEPTEAKDIIISSGGQVVEAFGSSIIIDCSSSVIKLISSELIGWSVSLHRKSKA